MQLTIEAEVKASRLVQEKQHCPSVMPVFDSIKIDENRVAMIVPFYPIPVSHTTVNDATIVNVALCGLATVKAFSNKGLCHGDIKPSNMMFQAGNRTVISIDFGSCTAYGNMLTATSPAFGMDCRTEASLHYDLTCLAASIMLLSGIDLSKIQTREDARSELASRTGLHFSFATLCLDESHVTVDEIWGKCKILVEVGLPNVDWVVDLDEIWPKSDKK
jgi:serine/threonine protein kinase